MNPRSVSHDQKNRKSFGSKNGRKKDERGTEKKNKKEKEMGNREGNKTHTAHRQRKTWPDEIFRGVLL